MLKQQLPKLAAFALIAAFSHAAMAADGTINFQGDITDSTCSVSPGSQNKLVYLGKVTNTKFTGVGSMSEPATFTIDLLDCNTATLKNAQVTFSGTQDGDHLAIANSGQVGVPTASGVAIQLKDSADATIKLGTPSAKYALGPGTNSLQFKANYIATQAAVTTGQANGVAQFTVAYN
ncbi:hypothetical protein APR50_21735 [Variovorax paradoxus]|jgi:major type 1 subunit fimbrin (pilin)|uniref:fimbrial protein n=1 Tax=Variovorax paradoxus TaxID=34073 RepID=UPI0006E5ABD0|nr:hypothetical protein APR52_28040 [Variovorax paradoxus]KPV04538.1 hypothetical protein APR50_21735 [Variovorax paradoxus]KPV05959.1 hypothetical protein APR49_20995 [Variovorax paradoxus]KPV18392.1 hypothetical protein APR51_23885 [Variovorax paradoxus]KPV25185.1 hypothetical protein APR48_33795 [Variovorax paradoxus]